MDPHRMMFVCTVGWLALAWAFWGWWWERQRCLALAEVIAQHVLAEVMEIDSYMDAPCAKLTNDPNGGEGRQ